MEVTIKIKDWSDIEILLPLFERLGISMPNPPEKVKLKPPSLPITFAEKADFMALAGIWKDKAIDAAALRKSAWGDRL
jgi:hypothetical protein